MGYPIPNDWVVKEYEPRKIALVAEVTVSPAHFRAVAKIAFHYALKMSPELTGLEPEFDAIKQFIWEGGDENKFVLQRREQFVKNYERARPTKWMHTLAVEKTYERIIAHAQFFVGPGILPPPYSVRIGRNPSRIDRGREARAHLFIILDPATSSGRMEDAEPAQVIWSP